MQGDSSVGEVTPTVFSYPATRESSPPSPPRDVARMISGQRALGLGVRMQDPCRAGSCSRRLAPPTVALWAEGVRRK